ncbi:hypothetical protein [Clostridium sp. 29_15]|uniref:hypothetical protein n=1 Tax=Clostridium sp. 29_15 TaxID=1896982 RepID=UPI000967D5E3|nr:hypothetical protein [Clostridium sp. 29_15]OKZ87367.1 MAG: hypothetical protein BHW04_05815 [Clostridium sp. 29_15]
MNKKHIKSIVIIVILLACLGGIYYVLNSKDKNSQVNGGASVSGYILEDGAEPGLTDDEIRELLQRQVDESSISFSISSDPIFKGKKAFLVMANPRYNAYDIDYVITVDGKELIRTAKIAPNQYIEEVELKEALPKGSYIGEALITGYNKETGAEVGKTIVELNITSQ